METLTAMIQKICAGGISRCVLSAPLKSEYIRINIRPVGGAYQAELLTQTQAFHENIAPEALPRYLAEKLEGAFRQLNAWDGAYEHSIRISKKGKPLYNRRAADGQAADEPRAHDREKNYLLKEGIPIAPHIDMGLLTKEGRVVHSMRDKYRQINRFLEMIDDEVKRVPPDKPFTVLDFGCGKSYLTFILYHYFTNIRGINVRMIGLDLKADVIRKCSEAAQRYGYENLSFEVGDIAGYVPERDIDMVVSLHACDTATDHALYNAIRWGAKMIFSVPCCQHELNAQMQSDTLSLLTRYGIVKERVAALMTDAIRANLLECAGYRAQLLEFIDMEHTPKNILIRAVKANRADRAKARAEAERLMEEFHLRPTLYSLLYPDA